MAKPVKFNGKPTARAATGNKIRAAADDFNFGANRKSSGGGRGKKSGGGSGS